MDKSSYILGRAEELAKVSKTWADLSNALFDPLEGEVVRAFPEPRERAAFRKTAAYRRLRAILRAKMQESGLVAGASPKKSGRFVVRLPSSLHGALEKEARAEGTSLNQLVLAKLAVQLNALSEGKIGRIIQALGEVRAGYSVDRVIADPQLNRKFLRRCRELGLSGTDFQLNWNLMNARKSGQLSHLPRTKRTTFRGLEEFEYASELAIGFVQREKGVSLDQVICDPDFAQEFDEYARRLSPGFTPLEYRWAALGLRKAGRLPTRKDRYARLPDLQPYGYVRSLRLPSVPEASGLYLFSATHESVFMSQTENLRRRLERHMDVSSGRGLPDWLWPLDRQPLQIRLAPLPDTLRSVRQGIELLFIRKFRPIFNYRRKAA